MPDDVRRRAQPGWPAAAPRNGRSLCRCPASGIARHFSGSRGLRVQPRRRTAETNRSRPDVMGFTFGVAVLPSPLNCFSDCPQSTLLSSSQSGPQRVPPSNPMARGIGGEAGGFIEVRQMVGVDARVRPPTSTDRAPRSTARPQVPRSDRHAAPTPAIR